MGDIKPPRTDCDCPHGVKSWGIGMGGWGTCGICGVSYVIDREIAMNPLQINSRKCGNPAICSCLGDSSRPCIFPTSKITINKNIMIYDQIKNKYNNNTTKYACVFYGFLQILRDMYGIKLKDKTVVKFVGKLKYFGILLRWGAYTPVLYKFAVNSINKKLDIKVKVKKLSITGNNLVEGVTYGVGHKMIGPAFVTAMSKGKITKEDLLSIQSRGGAGHHHTIVRKGDTIHCKDSWGGTKYTMSLDTLIYGVRIGLYYDPVRTIVPADDRTAKVLEYLKEMKTNKKFKFSLAEHPESEREYIKKAGDIYKGNFEMRF